MINTLYSQGLLDTAVGFTAAGLIGMLFGFFLEQAGFGSSRKLTAIFYFRDMAVLKVMFTAVLTALVGYQYLAAMGWLAPSRVYGLDTYWWAQIAGGLIFGVGFVMGGWCPGTAFVGLASFKADALIFLVGTVVGAILFNEFFEWVRPLYEGACAGTLFLSSSLHCSTPLLILVLSVVAVVLFALSTWIESRHSPLTAPSDLAVRRHRQAALLLLVLAGGTFALPKPTVGPPPATPSAFISAPAAELLARVNAGGDHIEALDLADRLMRGEADLTLVDIRSPEEYASFHLRGAVNVPLELLAAQAAAAIPRTGTVILYSNGTTHAAQAWLLLYSLGWSNVFVLTDGILGFWRECLTPPSLSPLAGELAAGSPNRDFAERRAFFLP